MALLFIAWAVSEVTYIPERLFSLQHHLAERSVLATQDYWSRYYMIVTATLLLRILGWFIAAAVFWKCGPRLHALLQPVANNDEASG